MGFEPYPCISNRFIFFHRRLSQLTCSPGARTDVEEEWRIADIARAGHGVAVGTVHARAAEGGSHLSVGTGAIGVVRSSRGCE
jgi:hypothetical protein